MAVYNILPSTNLRQEDIRDTLNAGGGNVGDNALDYFTERAKINMWSKNKPFRCNKDFANDMDRYNAYYGLNIETSGYSYAIPRGGNIEPCRLDDFRGYMRNAPDGITFKTLKSSKNIFIDKTPFELYLEDDVTLLTFYDIRHHPIFKDYNKAIFSVSNVSNGITKTKPMPVNSDRLGIILSYNELLQIGNGYVRITCPLSNGTYTNDNFIPHAHILNISSDTGINFNSGTIASTYIGTSYQETLSDNAKIFNYMTGAIGRKLDLTGKNFVMGGLSITNRGPIAIGQYNIYLTLRYTTDDGKAAYTRCPVYKCDSHNPVGENWEVGKGQYIGVFNAYIYDQYLPKLNITSSVKSVSLVYQFFYEGNFYDLTSSYSINLYRTSGIEPTVIT